MNWKHSAECFLLYKEEKNIIRGGFGFSDKANKIPDEFHLKYGGTFMRVVNLSDEVNKNSELYVYKKIGLLNEHVLSVVQVENRTLDFHVHEQSDELFYVIEGSFYLEIEERKMEVNAGEFVIVPKGTKHRPVVGALTKFLMIELSGTLNKENSGDLYED